MLLVFFWSELSPTSVPFCGRPSSTRPYSKKELWHTNQSYNADTNLYSQDNFCKSQTRLHNVLLNQKLVNTILNYFNEPAFPRLEVLISSQLFPNVLEALTCSQSVNDFLGINHSAALDFEQFSTLVLDLIRCWNIFDRIVEKKTNNFDS